MRRRRPRRGLPRHVLQAHEKRAIVTLRQDYTASAWRQSISCAGCATSMEPRYDRLARSPRDVVSAGDKRGDTVTIMPDGRIVVLEAVVTHPSAPTYVRRAAEETGHAAEQRALTKHATFSTSRARARVTNSCR